MKRRVTRIFGLLIAGLLGFGIIGYLSARNACAHDPRFVCSPRGAERPIMIENPQKSWAFYGHLSPGEEDHYRIAVPKALRVPWSLLIDERDLDNKSLPDIAVTDSSGYELARLDFKRTSHFYEPFSREKYVTTSEATLALAPGTYTAIVRMHGGNTAQRYTFAIGEAELFSPAEIPYVFGAIDRIRAGRY